MPFFTTFTFCIIEINQNTPILQNGLTHIEKMKVIVDIIFGKDKDGYFTV